VSRHASIRALAVTVIIALPLGACNVISSSSSTASTTNGDGVIAGTTAVASAYKKVLASPESYDMTETLTGILNGKVATSEHVTGQVYANPNKPSLDLINITDKVTNSGAPTTTTQVRVKDGVAYVYAPVGSENVSVNYNGTSGTTKSKVTNSSPTPKWNSMPLSELETVIESSKMASLEIPLPLNMDAHLYQMLLSNTQFRANGSTKVNGIPANLYTGTLSAKSFIGSYTKGDGQTAEELATVMGLYQPAGAITVTAAIDSAGLPVALAIDSPKSAKSELRFLVEYSDFGAKPTVAIPSA